jgi:hypothetical protein
MIQCQDIGGIVSMNKKIIYISGGESFSINDIRAAFDEVRETLGLSPDTVLFGVPTDAPITQPETQSVTAIRAIQTETKTEETTEENTNDTPIPILSVLSGKTPDISVSITEPDPVKIETVSITIEEMIADEIPQNETEKTLEQLLESMKPLQEDIPEPRPETTPITPESTIDATLEKLATEFADVQDEEPVIKNPTITTGRIGKLKNILPFKKAKRDESGLMGDLFGWAGIAANDDEFSMPDFFKANRDQ